MKTTRWKKYKSLTDNVTYKGIVMSSFEAQIREYPIAGTNQKGIGSSKKVYEIAVTDGYKYLKIDTVVGYKQAKEKAEQFLLEVYNQYKAA